MRAAVLAARAGMPDEAADRMAEAQTIARQVPDGIYHGTAFGPGSVRVHELALAVEAGNVARAVKLAGQWQPSRALPAERQSHFHIEAARAYCWAGNRDRAVTALWQARRAAPQHTRCNPAVIETIGVLIRGSRKPPPPLIQLATWIGHPQLGEYPRRVPASRLGGCGGADGACGSAPGTDLRDCLNAAPGTWPKRKPRGIPSQPTKRTSTRETSS